MKLNQELMKYTLLTAIGYDLADSKYLGDDFLMKEKSDLNKDRNLFNKISFVVEKYRKIYKNKKHFSNKKTSVYYTIIEAPDEIIFVFRGTTGLISWINDIRIKLTDGDFFKKQSDNDEHIEELKSLKILGMTKMNNSLKNSSISKSLGVEDVEFDTIKEYYEYNKGKLYFHSGFVLQYNSIAPKVNKQIDEYLRNDKYKRISFIGHSLGGALAQIAFVLQNIRHPEFRDKFFMTGFGTPKVGNKKLQEFTEYILNPKNNRVFFVALEGDLITTIPPNNMGYSGPLRNNVIGPLRKEYNHIKCTGNHSYWFYLMHLI